MLYLLHSSLPPPAHRLDPLYPPPHGNLGGVLVQTIHQSVSSITAHIGNYQHSKYGPVSTFKYSVGKRHDKHTLGKSILEMRF